ncbi:MAG: hypothetical protein KAI83_18340, partial [Thiomargarita sp.]|nr:hypothetical protein [Thiomargarita sp.]
DLEAKGSKEKGKTDCQENPASCRIVGIYVPEDVGDIGIYIPEKAKYSDGTPFDGVFMKLISNSDNIYQFEVVGSQATQMPSDDAADDVILEIPEVQYFSGFNEFLPVYCVKMTLIPVSNDEPLQFKFELTDENYLPEKPNECPINSNAEG